MKRKGTSIIAFLMVLFFFIGCAALQTIPFDEMTPKQKAIQFNHVYNKMYDDYLNQATNPDLTESQKVILRQKKAIFVKVDPLIAIYCGIVEEGGVISEELEDQIIDELNKLGGKF